MVEGFVSDRDKLEFRIIILEHIKSILKISLLHIDQENKMSLYISSVKYLGDVLLPFYDEDMNNYYNDYLIRYKNIFTNANKRIAEDKLSKYDKSDYTLPRSYELHRELFRQLNLLMKRIDYLKSTVYGEGEEDSETEEEGVIEDNE